MIEFWLLGTFVGVVVVMFIGTLLLKGLHYAIALALNSIIGFFALYAVQVFMLPTLVINIWSVLLVALLGLIGLLAVLLLHGIGLFF